MFITYRMSYGSRLIYIVFACTLALVFFTAESAAGQDVNRSSGMKDFGNRFEGTTTRKDALEDLTLVSIEGLIQPFSRNANLNVRFYLPSLPSGKKGAVFVEAVELEDSFHYFMEAKGVPWNEGNWNTFKPWPTAEVIDRLGIRSDNFGVRAGYQLSGKPKVYLPVFVRQTEGDVTSGRYSFHFMTGKNLQSVSVSVKNGSGNPVRIHVPDLTCNQQLRVNCILFAAGTTQSFDLDMSSLPEGIYDIGLVGHIPRTSDTTSLDILLYHRP